MCDDPIYELFSIKQNQIKMVRDRGYDITSEAPILNYTIDQFKTYLANDKGKLQNITYVHKTTGQNLLVFYGEKEKTEIGVALINIFVTLYFAKLASMAVLIVDANLSSAARKKLEDQDKNIFKYQTFHMSDLVYSPIEYINTPVHELLTDGEATTLLHESKTTKSRLNIIKVTDPVVKYYDWPVGGIVRIRRYDTNVNLLTPHSINYRVIIQT